MNLRWDQPQKHPISERPQASMVLIELLVEVQDDLLMRSLEIAVSLHWELIQDEASVSPLHGAVS
jgi:hypothetical protein